MRTVREDISVSFALQEAEVRFSRAEFAWEAVTFALARDPLEGVAVTESGKTRSFTLEGAKSIDMPTVTVLYVVDDEYVDIKEAMFKEATSARAGRA